MFGERFLLLDKTVLKMYLQGNEFHNLTVDTMLKKIIHGVCRLFPGYRQRERISGYLQELKVLQERTLVCQKLNFCPDSIFSVLYRDMTIKWSVPQAMNDSLQGHIVASGAFFELSLLEHVKTFLGPDPVILDAGANIGNHTIFFSRICEARKVFAVEPQRKVAEILEQNIRLNELSGVEVIRKVLGDRESRASLCFLPESAGNLGATGFRHEASGTYPMTTVDALNIDHLDLMKIDVEGSEYELLLGARTTIERSHPLIWVEIFDGERKHCRTKALLKQYGYRLEASMGTDNYLFAYGE